MSKPLPEPDDAHFFVDPRCAENSSTQAASLEEIPSAASRPPRLEMDVQPKIIVYPDNRRKVPSGQVAPWSLVCQLILQDAAGRNFGGTGWLGGPSTVYTAAHNLWDARVNYQAVKVWVIPGREGNAGPHGFTISTAFHVHPEWESHHQTQFDVAAIHLPVSFAKSVGYFGFGVYSDAVLGSIHPTVSGYPEDKLFGTQWYDSSALQVRANELAYLADTVRGESGSPVLHYDKLGRPVVIGIHTDGAVTHNVGVRITQSIHALMRGWWK